jgi:hypothetical protein
MAGVVVVMGRCTGSMQSVLKPAAVLQYKRIVWMIVALAADGGLAKLVLNGQIGLALPLNISRRAETGSSLTALNSMNVALRIISCITSDAV